MSTYRHHAGEGRREDVLREGREGAGQVVRGGQVRGCRCEHVLREARR